MSTVQLPAAKLGPAAGEERQRIEQLARRARLLSWLSLAWMTVEGAVAIFAGILAGSVALIGFGLDSVIEGFASGIEHTTLQVDHEPGAGQELLRIDDDRRS